MFLISITKQSIKNKFDKLEWRVNEKEMNSHYLTFITDNFLSKFNIGEKELSIIESLNNNVYDENNILVKVVFDHNSRKLSIFKPTHSGRPIYYYLNSKGEFFSSTHIKVLRIAGVPIQENTQLLPEFFTYRFVLPPNTLYKDIFQLTIGDIIHIDIRGDKCVIKDDQFYDPFSNRSELYNLKIDNSILQISNDLSDSISNLHSMPNRLAFLLSGGLDSSILFQLGKKQFNISRSYSTGYPFEDTHNNHEKEYAVSAAKAFGANHCYYEPKVEDYLDAFIRTIFSAEEPVNHLQSVLLFLLYENSIPQNENIIISGEGADGIFGNEIQSLIYNSLKHKEILPLASAYPFFTLFKGLSQITGRGNEFIRRINAFRMINKNLGDPDNIIYSISKYGDENWVCKYFNMSRKEVIQSRYNWVKKFENHSIYDIITMISILGSGSTTQSIWSKIGEANKLITYYPYYNKKIIEDSFLISWPDKLDKPKNILRKVAQIINIPEFIIQRPKKGFGIHPGKWAIKGGVFDSLIPVAAKIFDEKLIRNFQSNEHHSAMTFWNILNYSVWKRLFINNEPIDTLLDEILKI